MGKKEDGSNIGFTVFLITAFIASVIYAINKPSLSDDFAELGSNIMVLISMGIVYAIVKLFSNKFKSNNSQNSRISEKVGCLKAFLVVLGILLLLVFIFNSIGGLDYELNKSLGIFVFVVICIIVAYLIWKESK